MAFLRLFPASVRAWAVLLVGLVSALPATTPAAAQTRADLPAWLFNPQYFGRRDYTKSAVMDGNEIGITVFNTGLLGGIGQVRGTWPRSAPTRLQTNYVGDVWPIVALEVPVRRSGRDSLVRHAISTDGPDLKAPNVAPGRPGVFWTFQPKPGFASTRVIGKDAQGREILNPRLALSTDRTTWPDFWPDEPTWIGPDGRAQWNGYFGRDVRNADLETYFWTDDSRDEEMFERYGFVPDSTAPGRRGQGISMKVRGLQWSQFLAQDAIFWLYEVTNTSTTTYPRVAVGLNAGTLAGGDGDSGDDLAFFDQANRIVYSWDADPRTGNQGQPVGYVGYGFLESPGDALNGIDDDGDGDPTTAQGRDLEGRTYVSAALAGTDNTFRAEDFEPRLLTQGSVLVLIDPVTNRRSAMTLGSGPMTVRSQGRTYTVQPGQTLQETQRQIAGFRGELQTVTDRNLVDEDLDGIVDEDIKLHFRRLAQSFTGEILNLPALRYRNYEGFFRTTAGRTPTRQDSLTYGLLNPMIEEDRNDGVDNDGDWDVASDDVGRDGVSGTGDAGEGDGRPTDGEPNFDRLDVTESDQVGLTSFYYFTPPTAVQMSNGDQVWESLTPGFFTTENELAAQRPRGVDGDFIFGSGYFRLPPGQTLRFTLALVFGADLADITNNTRTIQEIYNRNYQFARPPDPPTLRVVAGDRRVTLYWDGVAEESVDPILGRDFEGYKIYRSTDARFRDPVRITDGYGNAAFPRPLAQYDLLNSVRGFWPAYTTPDYTCGNRPCTGSDSVAILQRYIAATSALTQRLSATPFYVGDNTGLRHTFVDSTDVRNGQDYYYCVTAYDRGSPEFYPAENTCAISVAPDGTVTIGQNVGIARPRAGAAGLVEGTTTAVNRAGITSGDVQVSVIDPTRVVENGQYEIRFGNPSGGAVATTFDVVRNGVVVRSGVPLSRVDTVTVDGVRFSFNNDILRLRSDSTRWVSGTGSQIDTMSARLPDLSTASGQTQYFFINQINWQVTGQPVPYDYEVRFGQACQSVGTRLGTGTSAPTVASVATNFCVYNATLGRNSEFALLESPIDGVGRLGTTANRIESIFVYETLGGVRTPVVLIQTVPSTDRTFREPAAGTRYRVVTYKPFTTLDRFTFTTNASRVDADQVRAQLENVRVVPNPYVVAASWEAELPQLVTSGRGERRIQFQNVPQNATIRIFTVRGELVRELRQDGSITNGAVDWNLRTREDLDVAYGVYFYHISVPGVGEKTGRIAIIK